MEINPHGIALALMIFVAIAWMISVPLVLLLHRFKIVKLTGCLDTMVYSFSLAILLCFLFWFIGMLLHH